jgi:hypothetical protein
VAPSKAPAMPIVRACRTSLTVRFDAAGCHSVQKL